PSEPRGKRSPDGFEWAQMSAHGKIPADLPWAFAGDALPRKCRFDAFPSPKRGDADPLIGLRRPPRCGRRICVARSQLGTGTTVGSFSIRRAPWTEIELGGSCSLKTNTFCGA